MLVYLHVYTRSEYTHVLRLMHVLQTGTTHIIFGVGNDIPRFGHPLPYSVKFGLQRVQLLKPDLPEPDIPSDTWYFDIVNPNVSISVKYVIHVCLCIYITHECVNLIFNQKSTVNLINRNRGVNVKSRQNSAPEQKKTYHIGRQEY